ncbi:MAG: carboxypeptidase-like regulatory domain-containing protein [Planctomycetota bacterium]
MTLLSRTVFGVAVLTCCATVAVAQGFKFLELRVLDEKGKPMPDVSVEVKMDGLEFPLPTDDLGMVSLNVSASERPVSLRIRHEGYEQRKVLWKRGVDVPTEYSIRMQPGKPILGWVADPDGNPVGGAHIFHASPNESLSFTNGRPTSTSKQASVTTDDEGQFTLPFQPKGSTIVCLCEAGWAQFVTSEERNGQQLEIRLKPWVQVRVDSQLADDQLGGGRLGLHFVHGLGKDRGKATWLYEGQTNAQGGYVCDRVIPGTAMAYRTVTPRVARGKRPVKYRSHGLITTLQAGKQEVISLGDAERDVRGKLFKPVAYPGTVDWDGGYVALTENNPIDLVLRTAIFEYGKLLSQSNVMRADQRVPPSATPNYLVRYLAVVEGDGSFVIENVPPGQYKMSAVLPASPKAGSNRRDVLRLEERPVNLIRSAEGDFFEVGEHLLSYEE